jgi:hypothetical protein
MITALLTSHKRSQERNEKKLQQVRLPSPTLSPPTSPLINSHQPKDHQTQLLPPLPDLQIINSSSGDSK